MTDLISVETYRRISGDATSDSGQVTTALDEAVKLVEEELNGRPLEHMERTEELAVKGGVVYPAASPITYADGDYEIRGVAVVIPDATLAWGVPQLFELTYQGGFTEATLPMTLRNAIVQVAHDQLTVGTGASSYPTGATSVKQGDASVTFAEPIGSFNVSGIRADIAKSIRKYRKARI